MFDLSAIQSALQEFGFDGWLLGAFRDSNRLARRVLDLDHKPIFSRRFFYSIPAKGEPKKLVHSIETKVLDHLPGEKTVFYRWQELEDGIAHLTSGMKLLAMEYSPRNRNPYVSRADAGIVELVRSFGIEVVSSGDLIQLFEATWDDTQWQLHLEAEAVTTSAYEVAWKLIADRTRDGGSVTECEVQAAILAHFEAHGVTTNSPPNVSVGPHSADPHFEPSPEADTPIRRGDFVLIDLWAKSKKDRGVYSDLTRVGYVGEEVPDEYEEIFQIVKGARDAAIDLVRTSFATKSPLQGWQVDRAARGVIEAAGYGPQFFHRTGHSIGQETHGNGANMDDVETHDERLVLPRTCFSIEPGIYFAGKFGVRSEVNVFVDASHEVHVTGGLQPHVLPILAG
ncbi:M24 family metallopeptidase [Singulisphaera sp. PoT]|uniref:M24 family metallopeptidase n=1 Tax=Singulisphaera sp. PoT TaxID=3411797 RepID=UPI003BF58B29